MFGLAVFGTPKSPKTLEPELCSQRWKSELLHLLFGGILPRSFAALSAPRNRASAIDVISNRVFVEPLPVGYPTEYWVKKDLYLANSLYWCSNYLRLLSATVTRVATFSLHGIMPPVGEVPERLNGAVSKTVVVFGLPWVRIPPSPPVAAHGRPHAPL